MTPHQDEQWDIADIIAGELKTSRAHAYGLMAKALFDAQPAPHKDGLPAQELLTGMDKGVLRMPFGLAMSDSLSQIQYYNRVQALLDRIEALAALPLPVQEAVHQFRKKHCSDWYDGHPDPSDGGGPYECRTLYAQPLPGQEAAPTMADAIAAGDGTLHGAIRYWQERALKAELAIAAHPKSQPASPERKPLTYEQWYDLAQRHARADWNSEQPDGYLNAVKALALDFAATQEPRT